MISKMAVSIFVVGACAALAAQAPVSAPSAYDPSAEVTLGGVIRDVVATSSPEYCRMKSPDSAGFASSHGS